MPAVYNVQIVDAEETATTAKGRFPSATLDNGRAKAELIAILASLGTTRRGRLRLRIDDSAGVKASGTVACAQANLIAGDALEIAGVRLVGKAGAADATLGQFSIDTSDTAVATSIKAAINGFPALKRIATADSGSGTVTITAYEAGSKGNEITLKKVVTTAGAFTLSGATLSSGKDPAAKPTVTVTLGGTGTANDTLSIGGVTLTLKASAANENEVTIGGSAAATATAIAAKITAHSKLQGLVSVSDNGAGVLTLTLLVGGRLGNLVSVTKSSTAITLGAASFAPATTDTYGAGTQEYDLGVPT